MSSMIRLPIEANSGQVFEVIKQYEGEQVHEEKMPAALAFQITGTSVSDQTKFQAQKVTLYNVNLIFDF